MLSVFLADATLWVSPDVIAMTGEPKHVGQARVYLAAASKAAAARYVGALPSAGGRLVGVPRPRDLYAAADNDFTTLDEAGLFEQPCVVVTARDRVNGRVVRITANGPRVIGELVRSLNGTQFVPAGTVTVTLAPAAAKALRELLAMVPDTEHAGDLLALLPPEISPGSGKS